MTAEEIAKDAVVNILSGFPKVDKLMISEKELCKKIKEYADQEARKAFDCGRELDFSDNDTAFDKFKDYDDYKQKQNEQRDKVSGTT
jgi:hypothetical protein